MHCARARLVCAVILLGGLASSVFASDDEPSLFSDEPILMADVVIRGQSPAPTQLRVAQTIAQPDGYYSVPSTPYAQPYTQPCPPGTAVSLPPIDPYSACPPPVSSPWHEFHFGVFGEFIYWQPRNADVPFGVPQNGIGVPGSTPIAPVAVADPGFSPGFRAGAFFALGPESRVIGTYTWFRSSTDTTVETAAPNVLNPLVLFPGTFNAGFASQQATANYDINLQMIDIDYQTVAECCNMYWWGYSGGARYARLVQDFSATFPFAPPDGPTSLTTTSTFQGVGPRAGLEGERMIFPSIGLRAYGKTSASFLVGKFNSTYQQVNQFGGTEVNTSLKQDRIVPILDFELGLAWLSPRERVRISGGYLVSAWFNMITTPGWISAVQNGSFQPGSDTLTFDGLTARGEVRF
jgi:hypothetical protein